MTETDASLSAAAPAGMRGAALRLEESAACADPQAKAYPRTQGCNTRQKCVVLATILHRNGQYHAASEFYRRAADWVDDTAPPFPPVPVLLRDSLLCLIQAGIDRTAGRGDGGALPAKPGLCDGYQGAHPGPEGRQSA